MSRDRIERRLRSACRLEPGETIVARCRAWVSRDRPMHMLLASRYRDFAVVTDRHLLLVASGFFTGRPRHRVHAARLDEITVTSTGRHPGRCLRVRSFAGSPLLLHLGSKDRAFADALLLGAAQAMQTEVALPTTPTEGT